MSQLRIFSYLPNPRIWKATIGARLAGVDVEVRGTSPKEPILNARIGAAYPRAMAHFEKLSKHPAFAPDVLPYLEKIQNAASAH
jgi:hypothetical protein